MEELVKAIATVFQHQTNELQADVESGRCDLGRKGCVGPCSAHVLNSVHLCAVCMCMCVAFCQRASPLIHRSVLAAFGVGLRPSRQCFKEFRQSIWCEVWISGVVIWPAMLPLKFSSRLAMGSRGSGVYLGNGKHWKTFRLPSPRQRPEELHGR